MKRNKHYFRKAVVTGLQKPKPVNNDYHGHAVEMFTKADFHGLHQARRAMTFTELADKRDR